MYPIINNFINSFNAISENRKAILNEVVKYICAKKDQSINLNFICTHNSRRSHLSQIWAQVAASYFNIPNVSCYSGGTEATAMFKSVKDALTTQGFKIYNLSEGTNPIYALKYSEDFTPIVTFSKKFDAPYNPNSNFAAIITCDHADKNCPIIFGAEKRFPVRYSDPKEFDGSDIQLEKYQEKSQQIAEEMFYIFEKVSTLNE